MESYLFDGVMFFDEVNDPVVVSSFGESFLVETFAPGNLVTVSWLGLGAFRYAERKFKTLFEAFETHDKAVEYLSRKKSFETFTSVALNPIA